VLFAHAVEKKRLTFLHWSISNAMEEGIEVGYMAVMQFIVNLNGWAGQRQTIQSFA
jgi:hypothetical protein